jgi:hypothetical protein
MVATHEVRSRPQSSARSRETRLANYYFAYDLGFLVTSAIREIRATDKALTFLGSAGPGEADNTKGTRRIETTPVLWLAFNFSPSIPGSVSGQHGRRQPCHTHQSPTEDAGNHAVSGL